MGNIKKVVGLTDYFVSLPPVKYFVISIILLGIIFGVVINFGKYEGVHLLVSGALNGLTLFSLPALLTAISVKLMIRKVPFKQIAATTFICEVIYSVFYVIGTFLFRYNEEYSQLAILLGAGLVFVLWYVVGRLIFVFKYRSILFAMVQLLFQILAIFLTSSLLYFGDLQTSISKFYIASFVLLGAIYIFFFIINAPMKRNFGVSSTDAISFFAGQWLYQEKGLEDAFEKVGESAKTLFTLLSFKRKNDQILFVTPYVHYGPFGNLGGSEFSYLLSDYLSKKYHSKAFVFHGTVTHDLNPVASDEFGKIVDVCNEVMAGAKYSDAKVSLSLGKSKECFAESLIINDCAFIGLSRAPEVTEDVNFGVGVSLMAEAEKYVPLAFVIDQHNAETGEVTSFEPGSHIAYNYMKATVDSLSGKRESKPLSIGVAERLFEHHKIGGAGVKVAIFSTDPEYVLVYFDCNGVTPEFRERLIAQVVLLGKKDKKNWHVGIYTTDTHEINNVKGVLNPLREDDASVQIVKELCRDAMKDMQPAKVYAAKRWFDIDVLGAKQSIEIVSTVNSIVAVAKILAPLILIGSLVAIMLLLGFV
ncbi:MAG: DUF2070 family protein [Candidatus Micrarchaeota archaeon]